MTAPVDALLLIADLERSTEANLLAATSSFQNLTSEELLKPSSVGGWSIAQCLYHLNSYGHFYLPHFKTGLASNNGNAGSEKFTSSWLGNYFTRMMNPETGKKKYKAFKNHVPPAILNAHSVVAEFIEQQETLLRYLNQARQVNMNTIRIPLSISRWITFKLGDAFRFLIAHTERHILQAKRNLS
jgi:hypothetical protein